MVVIPSKRRTSGRGFDSHHLHHKSILCSYDGGDLVSTGVDSSDGNSVGDDRKSSKTINANDAFFGDVRLAA